MQNFIKKTCFILGAISFSCSFSSVSLAQDYYKWIDKNGTTTYSRTPPPKNAKNLGKFSTYDWSTSQAKPSTPASNTTAAQQQNAVSQDTTQNQANVKNQANSNTDTNSSRRSTSDPAQIQ